MTLLNLFTLLFAFAAIRSEGRLFYTDKPRTKVTDDDRERWCQACQQVEKGDTYITPAGQFDWYEGEQFST